MGLNIGMLPVMYADLKYFLVYHDRQTKDLCWSYSQYRELNELEDASVTGARKPMSYKLAVPFEYRFVMHTRLRWRAQKWSYW